MEKIVYSVKIFINAFLGFFGLRLVKLRPPTVNPALVNMWENDDSFLSLYYEVKSFTATPIDGAYLLYQLAREHSSLPGDYAEIGVYRGGTAKLISHSSNFKPFHLYDTFKGMPIPDPSIDWHKEGMYSDTSVSLVKSTLSDCRNIIFHPGYFPESAVNERSKTFSFVYIDTDIYTSTINCCRFFYSRMVSGDVMLFDDYFTCPGVRKSVNEFFSDKPERPLYIPTTSGHVLVIKR